MKKTLKILLIVLSLVLVLIVLTGCGNNKENNDSVIKTENNTGIENNNNLSAKEVIARGEIDENNVYTSEFADITFKLPEGLRYADDTEIASMLSLGTDVLTENKEDLTELLEQTALYDMVAKDDYYGTSVMVMFEKATLNVSIDYYLSNVKSGLEAVTAFNYEIENEFTTETVGGKEYKVLTATVPTYGLTQKYFVEKKDGYFIVILVTYYDTYVDLDDLLASFQ